MLVDPSRALARLIRYVMNAVTPLTLRELQPQHRVELLMWQFAW
jgi:hypothetical protein